jgi:LysM repeat protein
MSNSIFRFAIFGLLFALGVGSFPSGSTQALSAYAAPVFTPGELIAAVNNLRASNGLPPYNANSTLMQVAQAHADYMAATSNTTHYSADGSRPFQRALAAGYPVAGDLSRGGWFSENIQAGSGLSPSGAVTAWQGDAPHLNTMLSANLFDVGAGVSKNGNVFYYVIDAGASGASSGSPGLPGTVVAPGTPLVSQFIVPVSLNTAGPDGVVYHEVQYGQTLWSIAIAYETKIDEIKSLNNLTTNDIRPGQNLLVKRGPPPVILVETATATASMSLPSETATLTATSTAALTNPSTTVMPTEPVRQPPGANLTVISIIFGALLFAALGTWLGTRKQI